MKKILNDTDSMNIISLLVIGILLFVIAYFSNEDVTYYEYVDLDGNKGYARICRREKGLMFCIKDDGTRILVKQYK